MWCSSIFSHTERKKASLHEAVSTPFFFVFFPVSKKTFPEKRKVQASFFLRVVSYVLIEEEEERHKRTRERRQPSNKRDRLGMMSCLSVYLLGRLFTRRKEERKEQERAK